MSAVSVGYLQISRSSVLHREIAFHQWLCFYSMIGLEMAKEELFQLISKEKGTRNKVLILITDGSQSFGDAMIDPSTVANELRNLGVHVFVIGIGTNIRVKELEAIAGNQANLYLASHSNQLRAQRFVEKLSEVGCEAGLYCVPNAN